MPRPASPVLTALLLLTLGACTTEIDSATRNTGIGAFSLDRLVVLIDEPIVVPGSRRLPDETVRLAVERAVKRRLGRFEGSGDYSLGIKVQGYLLSGAAIPVLFAPRSQLFLSVNAYDSVPARLNPNPRNLTVNEDAGADTVVGSGYSQTAEEQLAELAENAAIEIERWLRENEAWFGGPEARPEARPGAPPAPPPAAVQVGQQALAFSGGAL